MAGSPVGYQNTKWL